MKEKKKMIERPKIALRFLSGTPWRNGSASDSRSEGCVFESRRGHRNFSFPSVFHHRILFIDSELGRDIHLFFGVYPHLSYKFIKQYI